MISSQNVNNALTILRYKSFKKRSRERSKQQNADKSFKKRSRERSKQQNADNTTTTSTQNEEL
jgi:hypothetical protein